MHINCLIVDDEKELAENTSEYFNLYEVVSDYVMSFEACEQYLKENTVDMMLLDINLANRSGFELCKKIRKEHTMPILFISARDSDNDILMALSIGGDDYIAKPYTLSIILAKVKAVLKRLSLPKSETVYSNERLTVDFTLGKVYVNQEEIQLKAMEFKLLVYLVRNKGRIIPKEELFERIWEDSFTQDGTLNVHIRHLREKIEENPNEPKYIKTIWGRGYCYED